MESSMREYVEEAFEVGFGEAEREDEEGGGGRSSAREARRM
jgi:hypothetical protein